MKRALALLLVLVSNAQAAEQLLVLKDGRKLPVARMVRREGQVLFETTRGERFSVPEGQVVSPPLESIPRYEGIAPAAPAPAEESTGQTLVLKDGRRIPVARLARRDGQVLLQTTRGESFAVPESDVVSPALDTIPLLEAAPQTPPSTPAPVLEATPAPTSAPLVAAATPAAVFDPKDFKPLPDRWSIDYPPDPRFAKGRPLDPYNQNTLKGDRPIAGDSLFLVLGATAEIPSEIRRLPVGSGVSTADPGRLEFFGDGGQFFTSPRAILSAELFDGQTSFKPKTWALKATGVFDLNYLATRENNQVDVDVRENQTRRRQDFGLQEGFAEAKLATLSPDYDFVSVRGGIQHFVSDFRGFVFSDDNLGARVFGNAHDNRWQYNLAYFDLLEKDTNSELNTFDKRGQQVLIANVFRQDVIRPGYTLSASLHHSHEDATLHYDENGFLVRPAKIGDVRPHAISATYVGFTGDGHFGRVNVSHAAYYVFGTDERNPLAGHRVDVSAQMAALEVSVDHDWLRARASFFYASGDDDAEDGSAHGFDSIYDDSSFAGGSFSFWSRSGIALTQTGVLLKAPGSLLPTLRSSKFEGQASFVNPGLALVNLGLEADLTPKLKAVVNLNYLRFSQTGALQLLLFQPDIRKPIGLDMGAGVVYRPALNENVVVTAGVAGLLPGGGFDDIYSSICAVPGCGAPGKNLYNVFLDLKLTF